MSAAPAAAHPRGEPPSSARESRLSRRQSPGREDTASRLPSALPGPWASCQSRGPPSAGLASWSSSHSPPRVLAAPQQPPGRGGGRTESARRPETLLPVSAPPPGRPPPPPPPPIPRAGPATHGIVGDVVGACGEAARALSPGAAGGAVARQPRGAAD